MFIAKSYSKQRKLMDSATYKSNKVKMRIAWRRRWKHRLSQRQLWLHSIH